jgi:hypothetical protein
MKINEIDSIIKNQKKWSESETDEIYKLVREDPIRFILSNYYWIYFLLLSFIPFLIILKLSDYIIDNYIRFLDPVTLCLMSLVLFYNKLSIHFFIKARILYITKIGIYNRRNVIYKYSNYRILLLLFIILSLFLIYISNIVVSV